MKISYVIGGKKNMKKVCSIFLVLSLVLILSVPAFATSDSQSLTIPSNGGTLTSDVWRSTTETTSGNTLQWDYQITAKYTGSRTVQSIKAAWYSSASLRNSASINMSFSVGDGGIASISAGASSTWQTTTTRNVTWTNSNGSTSSWDRSNIAIGPKVDYRADTICTYNTATVTVSGDAKPYTITASV